MNIDNKNNNIYTFKHILYSILLLPDDIITNILLYDKYILREGKLILIDKIKKNDFRYKSLESRPLIFIYENNIINNKLFNINNSITIYNNILDKSLIDQYKYIYKSIQILKNF